MDAKQMEAKIKELEKKVQRLDDITEIQRLQRVYSYYVMHMMRDEIYDCFANRKDVVLRWLEGTWKGKEGVARYFGVGDKSRPDPAPGFIHQVMPIAGVVDVAADGKTAKGRWYSFGGVAVPDQKTGKTNPGIVGGLYEIDYIKEDGIWKFWKIDWIIPLSIKIPAEQWSPAENLGRMLAKGSFPGADEAMIDGDPRFVSGYIFPFHFDHPVTGKSTSEGKKNAKLLKDVKAAEKTVRDTFGLDEGGSKTAAGVKPKAKAAAKTKSKKK